MKIEQTYYFNENEYEKDGYSKKDGLLFFEKIREYERDFYREHPFTPANHLYINYSGMEILARCFISDGEIDSKEEIYGMDNIYDDMEANFNVNYKMDSASSKVLVYAISTAIDIDEPLYLVRDESQSPGSLTLKYISDNDYGDEEELSVAPVELVSME